MSFVFKYPWIFGSVYCLFGTKRKSKSYSTLTLFECFVHEPNLFKNDCSAVCWQRKWYHSSTFHNDECVGHFICFDAAHTSPHWIIDYNYIINILSCPVLDDGSEFSSKSGTPSPMVSRTRATVSSSDLLRDYRETSVASSRGSSDITEPDPGDNTGLAR